MRNRENAKAFQENMNAAGIVDGLELTGCIAARVATDIRQSKDRKEANNHLLQYMKNDANGQTMKDIFQEASEQTDFKNMQIYAADMLTRLQ